MKNQKFLGILIIILSLLAITFAIASYIYKSNTFQFRVIGIVCIVLSIIFDIYFNINKKQ